MKAFLCGKSRLLLGGLVCLVLALPAAARADGPRLTTPFEKPVKQLEAAVNAGDARAVEEIMLPTEDNLGREELLTGLAALKAEERLQAAVGAELCAQLNLDPRPRDFRIEIVEKATNGDDNKATLRVTWKQADANGRLQEHTREVPCYPAWGMLYLTDGFTSSSAEEARLRIDYDRDWARICEKTAQEVRDGKYQSVEEVAAALQTALGNSEPAHKLLGFTLKEYFNSEAFKVKFRRAIDEGLKEAFKKAAIREGVQK